MRPPTLVLGLLFCVICYVLASPTEVRADDRGVDTRMGDLEAPALSTRSEPEVSWPRLWVAIDALSSAFNRYRLVGAVGIKRFVGVRLDATWRRGQRHRFGVGTGVELWPMGRGTDGVLVVASGRVVFDGHERGGFVQGGLELGYRWIWRGLAMGLTIGAVSRTTFGDLVSTRFAPTAEATVGWSF